MQRESHGRRPYSRRGRDYSDATTNQEIPRIFGNHQKLGDGHGPYSSSQPMEEPTQMTS